jgi:hypothetical protein
MFPGGPRAFLQEERAGELPAEGGAIRHDSIQQQEPHERSQKFMEPTAAG